MRASGEGPASISVVGPPGVWTRAAAPSPTLRTVSVGTLGGRGAVGAITSASATSVATASAAACRRRGENTKRSTPTPRRFARTVAVSSRAMHPATTRRPTLGAKKAEKMISR